MTKSIKIIVSYSAMRDDIQRIAYLRCALAGCTDCAGVGGGLLEISMMSSPLLLCILTAKEEVGRVTRMIIKLI